MPLTKADLVEIIHQRLRPLGLSRIKCVNIIESLLEIMKRNLEKGDDIMISGFGKFQVKEKAPRNGRNPATGESMLLPARRVVTFRCSGKLRERLNNDNSKKFITNC